MAISIFSTSDGREQQFTTNICHCRWVLLRAKVLNPGTCRMEIVEQVSGPSWVIIYNGQCRYLSSMLREVFGRFINEK